MKFLSPFLSLLAGATLLLPSLSSAQIINIDFLGQRGSEPIASNYVGQGAAGGGTTFNGLAADNIAETDLIDVSGSDLLDSNGNDTTVGFSISDVGADNGGNFDNGILNGAYLFLNSANNTGTYSANFTISGLTSSTADLYFYTANNSLLNNPTITFTSGALSATPFTATGIFISADTIEFLNVPVISGDISGTYGTSNTSQGVVLGGLSVVAAPEPSTWALFASAALVLGWRLHRRGSLV